MKKVIGVAALLFILSGAFFQANAQVLSVEQIENSIRNDGKYAILVNNARHFDVSVMTGETYKKKSTQIQFEIVMVGKVIRDLTTDQRLIATAKKADSLGIRLVACEFAMKNLGVKKSELPHVVLTTANAFTYIFGLQENGFKVITL